MENRWRTLTLHSFKKGKCPCDDTMGSLNRAIWFSASVIKLHYWQVEMDKTSKPLMTFTVGLLGFYKFDDMPFGLVNTPAKFWRLMDTCLIDLQLNSCVIYLDDIIVFLEMPKDHLAQLRAVFQKLKEAGLKLKPSKHEILNKSLMYFRHRHQILEKCMETEDSTLKVIWK